MKIKTVPNNYLAMQGIALIQILIIAAILSLIAIFITKSAQQQVKMAQWSLDKSVATVDLHSARNQVIFNALTSQWQSDSILLADDEQWNLYNQPVQLTPNVSVRIQDQAGLINIHYPQGGEVVEKILLHYGLPANRALAAQDTLFDWQDADDIARQYGSERLTQQRNGPMPDIREWLLHNTLAPQEVAQIAANFSLYGSGHINLMTSPKSLLAALTNSTMANGMITLRDNGELSAAEIRRAVDLSEEMNIFFTPSNNLALKFDVRYGEARIRQKNMIYFTPYVVGNKPPYTILQTSGGE